MKVEGLRGCYEKPGGLFYFARMCSKVRLHTEGKLPEEYHAMPGNGFDGRTCRYLGVSYEAVRSRALAGESDAEVLESCFRHGRQITDEEVLIYNSFMSKRGWHDDETDELIPEMIRDSRTTDQSGPISTRSKGTKGAGIPNNGVLRGIEMQPLKVSPLPQQ